MIGFNKNFYTPLRKIMVWGKCGHPHFMELRKETNERIEVYCSKFLIDTHTHQGNIEFEYWTYFPESPEKIASLEGDKDTHLEMIHSPDWISSKVKRNDDVTT